MSIRNGPQREVTKYLQTCLRGNKKITNQVVTIYCDRKSKDTHHAFHYTIDMDGNQKFHINKLKKYSRSGHEDQDPTKVVYIEIAEILL